MTIVSAVGIQQFEVFDLTMYYYWSTHLSSRIGIAARRRTIRLLNRYCHHIEVRDI